MSLPIFPVTSVGSWPRSAELLRALKQQRQGRMSPEEFDGVADAAVLAALRAQEAAGVDVVTDGEQRRDNFYSFVANKLHGVKLMTLLEMLDVIEDKAGFEKLLQTLDVPAYSISNPTCVDRLERRVPLAVDELKFVQRHTTKPVKVPLPGPYLLTRAMWVKEVTQQVYASKEDLGEDVVRILREEIAELIEQGAAFIQLDEPVLTELVFTQGQTRTFMCAALAARKDPAEELEFAAYLINKTLAGFDAVRTGVHVCRGNWSRDESTLLRGGYGPLLPTLEKIQARQFVLEYATERAGDLLVVPGRELGLGVVNPRTDGVEAVAEICARAEAAARHLGPERVFLNPDCGFCTFASRPMSAAEIAQKKLQQMVAAAQQLRG
ncbi:MAG: cobalamin-independent methionine synthase II family protein [Verrucomicrobiales bacterium]|nr:cobalamin-independent methionine synthase II family protein [Verrucomicrobiales bacterium]